MLDNQGFDLWADGYDASVQLSEESSVYPFAGYKAVLNFIYNQIRPCKVAKILDIGFGTGVLTGRLYDDGYQIFGIDFSQRMLEIAQAKMPNARLYRQDFSQGLPPELDGQRFDFILCTYAIHHLDERQKRDFLHQLLARLTPGGQLLVGDVAFETQAQLEACRRESGGRWDSDEIYPVWETLRPHFPTLTFWRASSCAGVLSIPKPN